MTLLDREKLHHLQHYSDEVNKETVTVYKSDKKGLMGNCKWK